MKISASIYSNPDRPLLDVVRDLEILGVDVLHVDCRDNSDVFEDIASIRKISQLPIDLHLITQNPEKYYPLIESTRVEWVTLQYEELPDAFAFPQELHCTWGLSIVSSTPIEVFSKFQKSCAFVLFMTTTPGVSGGQFDEITFYRIREFEKLFPAKRVHVDGGVNDEVSFILRNMGVSCAVSGSYLVKAPEMDRAMLQLKTRLKKTEYLVQDFMLRRNEIPVASLKDLTHPRDVIALIARLRSGFCYLTNEDGTLAGVITDGDIRRAVLRYYDCMQEMKLSDLLNTTPVVVREDQTLTDMMALARNKENALLHLPVVDNRNRLVGGISFRNLIKGEL